MNKSCFLLLILVPFVSFGQGKQGRSLIDSLRNRLTKTPLDTNRVKLLDQISFTYSSINPNEGIKYGNLALELSEQLEWKKGIAMAYADLGVNYASISDHPKAIYFDLRALKLYEELNDKISIAGVLANISLVYRAQSDYIKALEYSFKALAVNEELHDRKTMAIILENTGTIYLEQKNYAKTIEYYSKAQKVYEKLGNKEGVARNLGNTGIVYDANGDYIKALEYHFKALETNKLLGNEMSIQNNYANIGYVYSHLKDFRKALEYQFMALKISKGHGDRYSMAIDLGNIGETYFAIAQDSGSIIKSDNLIPVGKTSILHKAINYLEEAIAICKEISFSAPQIEFNQYLSEACYLSGNYKKAFEIQKEGAALKDSVFSLENKIKLADLETRREIDLRDKAIIIKNKEIAIAKLEATNKRNERILYISGIILLLVLMGLGIRKFVTRNEMHRKELAELNRGLEAKVIERTAQWEIANKELEAFSYTVSHDLRAPLRAIDGYTRMIEEDYANFFDDEGKRLLGVVQSNANKMGHLIDDLLAFSKLGKKAIRKTLVDMNELTGIVLSDLNKSTEHHAEVKIHNLYPIQADYTLMRQVLVNLISNGIKYSSKNVKPVVEINSEKKSGEIIYSVKDNGVGFDMKYANKLFGVFQRLHKAEEFEGTGVGLAIVERIINRHGGRIWAEAIPDNGATFYFSLPTNNIN